jgi:hypothetical protein
MEPLAHGFTMPLIGEIGKANVSRQLSPDNVGRRGDGFGENVFLWRRWAHAVCIRHIGR